MKKFIETNEPYMDDWHDQIVEAVSTGDPKDLQESLGKYIPFKVKKHIKGKAYDASFVLEQDGEVIRKYHVSIGKQVKSNVSSDFGKVSSMFHTIIFSEENAGIGVANLEGGTGLYVLNTVARIVLEFARSAHPKGFTFTAAQTGDTGGTANSRRKAYRALSLMLGKEAGYVNITRQSAMTTGSFYLMKKGLFEAWQDAINSNGVS